MSENRQLKVILGCTGSVASIRVPEILRSLQGELMADVRIVATEKALHFFERDTCNAEIITDSDEWTWRKIGDPIKHIQLRDWADVFVLAPLDCNTLAKLACGICDNLLTCILRAWPIGKKPVIFAPAMNTGMWDHPITAEQISRLKSWGFVEVPCCSKKLACGDIGLGAIAATQDIISAVSNFLQMTAAVMSNNGVLADDDGSVAYWRRLAEEKSRQLTELQADHKSLQVEYADFQTTSRELETELESQIDREMDAKEKALRDVAIAKEIMENERDSVRERVAGLQAEVSRLEVVVEQLQTTDKNLRERVRALEQENDNLERNLRVTAASLEDVELRFGQALEEKALLTTEVTEKDSMQVLVQRLKDEVRDLRQEMNVRSGSTSSGQQQQSDYHQSARRESHSSSLGAAGPPPNTAIVPPLVAADPEPNATPQKQNTSGSAVSHRRSVASSTRQAALECVHQLIHCVSSIENKVDNLRRRRDLPASNRPHNHKQSNSFSSSTPMQVENSNNNVHLVQQTMLPGSNGSVPYPKRI